MTTLNLASATSIVRQSGAVKKGLVPATTVLDLCGYSTENLSSQIDALIEYYGVPSHEYTIRKGEVRFRVDAAIQLVAMAAEASVEASLDVDVPDEVELDLPDLIKLREAQLVDADLRIHDLTGRVQALEDYFVDGMTGMDFGRCLPGINSISMNKIMLRLGWIRVVKGRSPKSQARYLTCHKYRDMMVQERITEYYHPTAGHMKRAQVVLTKAGAVHLYDMYLKGQLIPKKSLKFLSPIQSKL